MSSVFADLWRAAEPDLDATLGEPFQYIPRAAPVANGVPDVNARSVPDMTRLQVGFVGRFFEAPKEPTPHGRNKPASSAHRLSGAGPVLSLSGGVVAALQASIMGTFQVNDWITRDADGQAFRIEDIQPLDLGMVEFILTRIGSPSL
jgi:hypothetical protein